MAKGFSEDEIDRIPVRTCFSSDGENCIICLEDIAMGDRIIRLECGHQFNELCLKQHLAEKKNCPSCLQDIDLDALR